MLQVTKHYEELLAERYDWMLGELRERQQAERERLLRIGLAPASPGQRAVDLGCGTGLHSRVLHDLGYAVTAVDHSPTILSHLDVPEIQRANADLVGFDVGDADVVVCMGDTLTHLLDLNQVNHVLSVWRPGRSLVLSFRDLRTLPKGTDRFFVVRADPDRIHTCFLEDLGERVRVHDLFHERSDAGWQLLSGWYDKLRLNPESVVAKLSASGARVRVDEQRGLVTILAS